MTFMLGAFTQGLTQGAKDIYGLENESANTAATREHTAALKQQTDMTKQAFDAGQTLASQQPVPQTALNVTPSDSGPTGGGPGTTTNGPVAPLNFTTAVPQPSFMPQSAPGSASGYGPSYNPEAGPAAAAQQQTPAIGNAPLMPSAPTLASGTDRNSPTALGGSPGYNQSFTQPTPQGAVVRPIVQTDPTQSNQAIPTNTVATAKPGQDVPAAAMPTYDLDPANHNIAGSEALPTKSGAALPNGKVHSKGQTSSNNLGRKMASVLNVG